MWQRALLGIMIVCAIPLYASAQTNSSILNAIANGGKPVTPPDVLEQRRKLLELEKLQLEIQARQQALAQPTQPTTPAAPRPLAANAVSRKAELLGGNMESLLRQCDNTREITAPNAMEYGQCRGYLFGTLDTLASIANQHKDDVPVCLPVAGISVNQAIKIFQKWGADHPEWLHESARIHVMLSLMQAFPCTSK